MIRRKINIIDKKILISKYGHIINSSNIAKVSKRTINIIFQDEEKHLKEAYVHNVLQDWIDNKKNPDLTFNSKVIRTIKRTGIELTEVEKHNLFLFEEQIFSKDRHIKIIEVNEKLLNREIVGVKFEKATLFKLVKDKMVILDKGTFLISNQRFFFTGSKEWNINFKDVEEHSNDEYGFNIISKTGLRRIVKIHDLKTLENTINNFFKRH